jgi:translocation and assembly module TamB
VDKGGIELKGTLVEHEFVVTGAGSMGKLGFRAHGAYGVDGDEWQGELSHLQLETLDHGIWRQEKQVSLTAGSKGVLLEELCLADEGGEICLGGDVRLEKESPWTVRGKLISVPIEWLNRLGLVTVPVSGKINAAIAANGDSRAVLSARIESKVSEAALLMNVDETEQIPFYFEDSVLTLDLTDGLLQGNINIQMQNDSQLVLSANVEGVGDYSAPLDSLPLRGHLDLKKFDLALLATFTGYGVEPSGRVNNSFTLEGTVGQPKIYGEISIEDGGIDLPYQGIILENIVLSIDAGEDVAKISGKATSGPGQLTATGTVRYGMKGIEGTVNVKGDDFLLVNLPEYAIRVKPDLLLSFENDTGELSGTIEIPYGLITPEEMSGSISVSEDVIIVNGTKEERAKGLPIKLNLNVRLGDDVRIDGYGLTGRLEGELNVLTNQDNSLSGRGTLNLLGGTFAMYGQKLTIERGRVLFTGGPLDNPGVDVRAQRQITDKKLGGESYIVGIDISGLVQDLQYHLYSDPFMEDTEILSFMISGRSMANSTEEEGNMLEAAAMMLGTTGSSGFTGDLGKFMLLDDLHFEGSSSSENMALVVGKRLTEELYIGYDLNMFSQLGQFRVRYDLTRGFSVETTSSAESTGADLLYTFER